jgi:hypothetical protein
VDAGSLDSSSTPRAAVSRSAHGRLLWWPRRRASNHDGRGPEVLPVPTGVELTCFGSQSAEDAVASSHVGC